MKIFCENGKKWNFRAFISISLFVFLIILFASAIAIEILDHVVMDRARDLQRVKRVHVVSGYIFVALSVVHIIKNWKVVKSYLQKK